MSLRVAGIYCSGSTMNQNYTNILLMLLRHRQACDHPFLSKIIFPIAEKIPRDMQINQLNCLVTMVAICRVYDVSFFFFFLFLKFFNKTLWFFSLLKFLECIL